jgi:two-component system, LytTR family, sensor kinase
MTAGAWPADAQRRYWITVGTLGWLAVGVIAFADMGMQKALAGHGFFASWHDLASVAMWLLPGALASVLIVVSFRAWAGRGRSPAPWHYLLLGVGFWLSWSLGHAALQALMGGPDATSLAAGIPVALPAHLFTSTTVFTVLVVLNESAVRRQEARDRELHAAALRSELARARTAALAAQLDPHFLFNTLHVASGLMEVQPAGARHLLEDLRALMDQALRHNESMLVPLRDELALVHRYLRIQKARFGDRLTVEVRVTEEARRCMVPPLVLQPLVENAVQHGIGRGQGGGSIVLEASRQDDRLVIHVVDTGGERADPPLGKPEGLGLAGVRARLDLLFGSKGRLEAAPIASGGFLATAELPAVQIATEEEAGV